MSNPRDKAVAEERKYMELAILNQQNSVANVTNLPKSKSIITPMTKEMIQDYKDTLEAYGKKGGEQLYDIPDVELEDFEPIPTLTDAQKNSLDVRDQRFANIIRNANQSLQELDQAERQNIREKEQSNITKRVFLRNKEKFATRKAELLNIIGDAERKIQLTQVEKQDSDYYEELNKAEKQRVDSENKELLRLATETAKMQNSELKLESQGPNESNEEYADRLASLKNIVQPDIVKDDAEILVMRKFNSNMMELIRNKAVITQILQELGLNQAFEFNKVFPAFKKRFLEIYGYNNTALSADLIADAIKTILDKGLTIENYNNDKKLAQEIEEGLQKAGKAVVKEIQSIKSSKIPTKSRRRVVVVNPSNRPEGSLMSGDSDLVSDTSSLAEFARTLEPVDEHGNVNEKYLAQIGDLFFIKYQPPKPPRGKMPNLIYMFSNKPEKDSFRRITAPAMKFLTRTLELSEEDILTEINEQIQIILSEGALYKPSDVPGFVQQGTATADIMGWGVKTENIPESAPLGKIRIKPRKLYYDNILVIKDHKGGNIPSAPNMTVSDNMVKLLFKILKNQSVSEAEVKELITAEQNLYNLIIRIAQLHKIIPNTGSKTIDSLKKHLELIEGEISAGNDNPKLLKDAKAIVKKLYSFSVITPKEANNYIEQLKEMF